MMTEVIALKIQKLNDTIKHKMNQKTLVLIKPDAVKRNLIGEIIKRFEDAGLKIVTLKMLTATPELAEKHYAADEDYLRAVGQKSVDAGDKVDDVLEQGRKIINSMRSFLASGPIVAMVIEGEDAIPNVRKLVGYTDPSSAEKGTIRGDFGEDSILKANSEGRPVYNLVHASGNPEEAEKEIALWFPQ